MLAPRSSPSTTIAGADASPGHGAKSHTRWGRGDPTSGVRRKCARRCRVHRVRDRPAVPSAQARAGAGRRRPARGRPGPGRAGANPLELVEGAGPRGVRTAHHGQPQRVGVAQAAPGTAARGAARAGRHRPAGRPRAAGGGQTAATEAACRDRAALLRRSHGGTGRGGAGLLGGHGQEPGAPSDDHAPRATVAFADREDER